MCDIDRPQVVPTRPNVMPSAASLEIGIQMAREAVETYARKHQGITDGRRREDAALFVKKGEEALTKCSALLKTGGAEAEAEVWALLRRFGIGRATAE